LAELEHGFPHLAPSFDSFPHLFFMTAGHIHGSRPPVQIPVSKVKVGTMPTAAILMAAAGRGSTCKHHFDKVPLDGVFAQRLKLIKEFYYCPRSHMPPRLLKQNSYVKQKIKVFIFF
jgi:hypothetical protein